MKGMRQLGAVAGVILLTTVAAVPQPAQGRDATTQPAPKGARITSEGWLAPRKRDRPAPALPDKITKAFVIPIRDPDGIEMDTLADMKRMVAVCKRKKAELVIFDIDTPGGLATAMEGICDLISKDLKDVYTVAYANPRAISAGAIISLACTEIVMAPGSRIGDSMSIWVSGGKLVPIPDKERGKFETDERALTRLLAERNGHNVELCEAMITSTREIWRIRNRKTREIRIVDPDAKNWRRLVADWPDTEATQESDAKLDWEFLEAIDRQKDLGLVMLTDKEAIKCGFVDHIFKDLSALTKHYNVTGQPARFKDDGSGDLVSAESKSPTTRPAPENARSTDEGWLAPRKRGQPKPALGDEVTKAFVITIRDPNGITLTTLESFKRNVTLCKGKGAELVIVDLDTPGGRSDAMEGICDLIRVDLKDVYTIAYVNPRAISAGAIISLACTEIVMAPGSRIGDSMPIMIAGGKLVPIPDKERGKIETNARTLTRVLAQHNGHNTDLCEAMITSTREIWRIRNRQTREVRVVDPDAKHWRRQVANWPGTEASSKSDAKLEWEFLKAVDREKDMGLVMLTDTEAIKCGFVDHVFKDFDALEKHYNVTVKPVVLGNNWSEGLVGFLTSPALVSILMTLGIMCIYMEFNTPGFGVAGGLAIACFAIIFGSHFLIGLANWWEIGLFVLGVALIGVEIFVIPGFGVAGVSGITCCVIGLMAMVVPNAPTEFPWPQSDLDWSWFGSGLYAMGLGFAGGVIGAVILAQYLPKIPIANRLVMGDAQAATDAPATADAPIMHVKVGDTGIVETMCRPVGQVRFGKELCDATADGTTIEAGAKVRVIERTGNQLIVKEV
ncbi:MAG: NfeD family protein [Phycisphaerae bacterium]|jgi:membrane-bound serine protease (ClpP class)|nr:NfeD family protein [Phycisphaerae bacterium]